MAYRSLPNPTYFTLPTNAMRGLDANGNAMAFADFSGFAAATGYHIFDLATTTCINAGANCRQQPVFQEIKFRDHGSRRSP